MAEKSIRIKWTQTRDALGGIIECLYIENQSDVVLEDFQIKIFNQNVDDKFYPNLYQTLEPLQILYIPIFFRKDNGERFFIDSFNFETSESRITDTVPASFESSSYFYLLSKNLPTIRIEDYFKGR